nr:immunoglobulin superfamily member 5 [Nothobranchius furzeri]
MEGGRSCIRLLLIHRITADFLNMDMVPLLVLLLSCRTQALRAQLKLSPDKLTVVRGDEARFSCSTSSSAWTVMVWMLNGRPVQTISKETGVLPSINPNITAERCPNSKEDCWVIVLKSTERSNQGEVTCDLQLIEKRTAKLFVQEKGSVRVVGDDRLAFKGKSVLFQCQAEGWYPQPVLQWQVHGKKVSPGDYNSSIQETDKSLFMVSSNVSVMAERTSPVDCLASVSALSTPLKSRVTLIVVVEVSQVESGCSALLGATTALSALLLLMLLSICTVLCYRRRRNPEKDPQEVIRFDQSLFGRGSVAEATGGSLNMGYSGEGPTDVDSIEGITEVRDQVRFDTFRKVPDVVHSSSESQANEPQQEPTFSNVRRLTTV